MEFLTVELISPYNSINFNAIFSSKKNPDCVILFEICKKKKKETHKLSHCLNLSTFPND